MFRLNFDCCASRAVPFAHAIYFRCELFVFSSKRNTQSSRGSGRYSLVLACPMDLQKYPLDTQRCKLEMECYSYETDAVRLRWRAEEPLELPDRLFLSSFSLTGQELVHCANIYTSGKCWFATVQHHKLLKPVQPSIRALTGSF